MVFAGRVAPLRVVELKLRKLPAQFGAVVNKKLDWSNSKGRRLRELGVPAHCRAFVTLWIARARVRRVPG